MNTQKDQDFAKYAQGLQFPFDNNGFTLRSDVAPSAARYAALAVMADLCDRGGLRHCFEDLDKETKADIVDAITSIVSRAGDAGFIESVVNYVEGEQAQTMEDLQRDHDQMNRHVQAVRECYDSDPQRGRELADEYLSNHVPHTLQETVRRQAAHLKIEHQASEQARLFEASKRLGCSVELLQRIEALEKIAASQTTQR